MRPRPSGALVGLLVVVLAGLSLGAARKPTPTTTTLAPARHDPSARLFDPSVIHDVRLDLSDDAMAQLRASCTAWERILSQDPECDARVPTRLIVDGTTVDNVGVRLKGGVATWRPVDQKASFSIKTDEFVTDQEIFGERRFTLNSEIADPSFAAETLTYDVFRANNVPAPRTVLANVSLNGEHIGLYVLRENYDKRFLKRNFADGDGNLYESTTPATDIASPGLWKRTNETTSDNSDLVELTNVVQTVPDAQYQTELAKVFNLGELYRYWAAEALTAQIDGYAYNMAALGRTESPWPNNFYAYHDPSTDKFVILPYGADASFGIGFTDVPPTTPALLPPKADSTMAVRLWAQPGTTETVRRSLLAALSTAWDEKKLLARADQLAALVRADGLNGTRETTTMAQFEEGFAARRAFIVLRPAGVRAELNPPATTPPATAASTATTVKPGAKQR
jgi:hypothetical protein